jgi:hypothetical protein
MSFQGIVGCLPEGKHDLPDVLAWLAWLELWRSEETLVSTIARIRDFERGLLARTLHVPASSAAVHSVVALVDGLLGAVCQPADPLSIELARRLLTQHVDLLGAGDVTPRSADGSTG